MTSRCCLGTAQLGMPYGIANRSGKPSRELAQQIIERAWQEGIRTFDTAQDYGESEAILGESLGRLKGGDSYRIVTKLHRETSAEAVRDSVARSLDRMKTKTLWAILVHSSDKAGGIDDALVDTLRGLKREGLVHHIGASVYSPEAAKQILEMPDLSLVQAPFNLLDQRLSTQGIFTLAKKLGKMIFCRSIFLQGLLVLSSSDVPSHLQDAKPFLAKLSHIAENAGMSLKKLAVAFAFSCSEGSPVIFGAETPEQVEETCKLAHASSQTLPLAEIRAVIKDIPSRLIDPTLWPAFVK